MNKKRFLRLFSSILFFGLCIAMLSKGVTASAAENEVKLNVTEVSVIKDGTYRLKVYNLSPNQSVTFRSADSSIASVTRSGRVTGITCGTTVVSAIVSEAGVPVATLQCDVLIGPAAVSIKLTKTELVLAVGKMKALKTIIFPLNTVESPTFYSEDTTIAKVSSSGRVRAYAEGSVQIYAFLSNGQSAVCEVTVLDKEDYKRYLDGVSIEELLGEDVIEEPDEPAANDGTDIKDETAVTSGTAVSVDPIN